MHTMNARERRVTEAVLRQETYDELTPKQKLAKLDARLGEGVGARKERVRLKRQMEQKKH